MDLPKKEADHLDLIENFLKESKTMTPDEIDSQFDKVFSSLDNTKKLHATKWLITLGNIIKDPRYVKKYDYIFLKAAALISSKDFKINIVDKPIDKLNDGELNEQIYSYIHQEINEEKNRILSAKMIRDAVDAAKSGNQTKFKTIVKTATLLGVGVVATILIIGYQYELFPQFQQQASALMFMGIEETKSAAIRLFHNLADKTITSYQAAKSIVASLMASPNFDYTEVTSNIQQMINTTPIEASYCNGNAEQCLTTLIESSLQPTQSQSWYSPLAESIADLPFAQRDNWIKFMQQLGIKGNVIQNAVTDLGKDVTSASTNIAKAASNILP